MISTAAVVGVNYKQVKHNKDKVIDTFNELPQNFELDELMAKTDIY